jgi:hypothetical protein
MDNLNENFKNINDAFLHLNARIQLLEEAVSKMPPPGPSMIQYKPPGSDEYKNLKQVFDDLYERLNTIETVLGI